jgi:predicted NUDIX family NTP pyrophosphohydrolase
MNQVRTSAGLLMYRFRGDELQVFLAHPGGPFFQYKDNGHWTIPKGELGPGEDLLTTAIREFREETGIDAARGGFIPLGSIRQRGGKIVHGWAFAGDCPDGHVHKCNYFKMEWPPHSGNWGTYLEVDRVGFFSLLEARRKMKDTQRPFLDRLTAVLNVNRDGKELK